MRLLRTLSVTAVAAVAVAAAAAEPFPEPSPAARTAPVWSAHRAAAFWTPERMASARPVPDGRKGIAAVRADGDRTDGGDPGPGPEGTWPAVAAGPGIGQDFGGIPVVGRMFTVKGGGAYFCTASAVASPGRDLVLTAAHCLTGSDTRQIAFVPRYTAALPRPYGMFPVRSIWIDPRYRQQGPARAAALDVAFARVGPGPDGRALQEVVGANRLVTRPGYAHPSVHLIGHPARAPRPRVCVNRTTRFTSTDPGSPGSFLRIACTGYPGGTSGGPFLADYDPRTRTGRVIGIIGGYQTGGNSPDTSYSPYFGPDVRRLYEQAVGPPVVAFREGIVS
ncbi:serine protease [Streptomyces sp. NPDC002054]|uniref:trypsin-like serine peptidase n=1 Tax=Streptomyces sp. NPDC002054 TaxID=3154663 RepID=UPI003331201B